MPEDNHATRDNSVLIASSYLVFFNYFALFFVGAFIVSSVKKIGTKIRRKGFSQVATITLLILTIGLGSSLGFGLKLGALSLPTLAAVLGTGLPLAGMLLYPSLQRRKLIAQYRQLEGQRIKP